MAHHFVLRDQDFANSLHHLMYSRLSHKPREDFRGGPVVKNLPASAEDMGLIPAPGRFHWLWGN